MSEGLIVGKYGSRCVASEIAGINHGALRRYAKDWAAIHATRGAILVSSGAVMAGKAYWRTLHGENFENNGQPFAMMGNPRMMQAWQEAFRDEGVPTAEFLATHRELNSQRMRDSEGSVAKRVLKTNLAHDILTIVNYNDALSTEELEQLEGWGDNDYHALHIAKFMGAKTLYLATESDGLCHGAGTIHYIGANEHDWARAREHAGEAAEGGTGGMGSKTEVATEAARLGIETIIASANVSASIALREIYRLGPTNHQMKLTYFEPLRAA